MAGALPGFYCYWPYLAVTASSPGWPYSSPWAWRAQHGARVARRWPVWRLYDSLSYYSYSTAAVVPKRGLFLTARWTRRARHANEATAAPICDVLVLDQSALHDLLDSGHLRIYDGGQTGGAPGRIFFYDPVLRGMAGRNAARKEVLK